MTKMTYPKLVKMTFNNIFGFLSFALLKRWEVTRQLDHNLCLLAIVSSENSSFLAPQIYLNFQHILKQSAQFLSI